MKIEKFDKKYYFLSNFYDAPVIYDGDLYENNEAAFQAAKIIDRKKRQVFFKLPPNKAKSRGRQVELRKDWEEVKDGVMYECVKDKFGRNNVLRERLLETGEAELIEGNHWNDHYWGVCNGTGQNKLGKILMKVRQELREKK